MNVKTRVLSTCNLNLESRHELTKLSMLYKFYKCYIGKVVEYDKSRKLHNKNQNNLVIIIHNLNHGVAFKIAITI